VKDSRNAGVSAVLYEQGYCLYFTERWALRRFLSHCSAMSGVSGLCLLSQTAFLRSVREISTS